MEFLLDTANLGETRRGVKDFPITGLTSNPSIIKREGKIDFFNYFKEIRKVLGRDRGLHIQVVAEDAKGIVDDAHAILKNVDDDVYIKLPITPASLEAIAILRKENINITATAIYTKMQGYLALAAGVDYLVPYYNRMENLNICPKAVIAGFADKINKYQYKTKILAASFKNVAQINEAFDAGAQSATVAPSLLYDAFKVPSINGAIKDFKKDWEGLFGEGTTIANL
ncbi:MAG: fructose-6-phosphate aldolase [Elusimicrobiota bacterium]|jgi:TalC/MipB family fructose-6-phosphate aldolase|nr:fructose-6-phosphate aldolase [Elusimicrobiota bacterium]